MPTVNDFFILSSDLATKLYVREHIPDNPPKAVLQISHEVLENISRYDEYAEFLSLQGFLVIGNDHLGHGRSIQSNENFGHFSYDRGWEKVLHDMRKVYETTAKKYPNTPYFILGHGMGSYLLREYVTMYSDGLSGILVSGTGQPSRLKLYSLLAVATSHFENPRNTGRGGLFLRSRSLYEMTIGSYGDKMENALTESDWISRDQVEVEKYREELKSHEIPTAMLIKDLLSGILEASNPKIIKKQDVNLPIFMFSGDEDPAGENGEGVLRAYKAFLDAGCTDVTLKLYPNARHAMLHELNRHEVFEDTLNWMVSKIGLISFHNIN